MLSLSEEITLPLWIYANSPLKDWIIAMNSCYTFISELKTAWVSNIVFSW